MLKLFESKLHTQRPGVFTAYLSFIKTSPRNHTAVAVAVAAVVAAEAAAAAAAAAAGDSCASSTRTWQRTFLSKYLKAPKLCVDIKAYEETLP